ncbi:MAG: co-chaperone GroES [Myxococcota bacterium]|nr:co-chaperone GroES [Myxococcota bacterium]
MKLKPLYDRIIVKRIEAESQTASGLYIPDTAQEKPAQGEVIAAGAGKVNDQGELRALQVKVGDRVLFGKYAGNEVKLDGTEHVILREDEVLAIVES